ncbi:MAG: S41 family peptidase [Candidatus Krumholzibacteriota bacterium]|nr:S41 family peptidase [Candidatus Krumholzibacteriota bacterium]
MKFNKKVIITLVFLIVIAAGSFFVWASDQREKNEELEYEHLNRFRDVMVRILDYYVEEKEFKELIDAAIAGMLEELDVHSVYLDQQEYENLMIDTEGEFGGLGIQIVVREDYPTVISPIDDTPASRLGIQGGDKIVDIEGESTKGWSSEDAVKKLRGRPGTQVNIKIGREGLDESIPFTITREIIKVPSITYSTILDDVGYVRIARFAKKTAAELSSILREFEKENTKGVILDLRGNPGGLLSAAFEVSDLFLDRNKLIVYTESRIPESNQKFNSNARNLHGSYPIVILINGGSASASEIVAGALQDWDRAVIVGQTSFGKGSVQTVFKVGEHDALKLTTQKYFTPSGRCIHKDYDENGDVIKNEDSEKEYYTASGRVVYGGGGISPDWKIELPEFTEFQRKLEIRSVFFSFAVHYTAYNVVGEDFVVDDSVVEEFKAHLAEKEIENTSEEWTDENSDYIRRAIRREIFRKLYGTKGAYIATLDRDEEVVKVLEMFRQAGTLDKMFSYVAEHRKAAATEDK